MEKGKMLFWHIRKQCRKQSCQENWKEELDMDADMTIIQGKAKIENESYIGCSYRGIWL